MHIHIYTYSLNIYFLKYVSSIHLYTYIYIQLKTARTGPTAVQGTTAVEGPLTRDSPPMEASRRLTREVETLLVHTSF